MVEQSRKIMVTKISKSGFSKTVGSSFGFGSWTIGGTMIELEVDPPIDLTTEEGQTAYKKLKDTLGKLALKALKDDVALACKQDTELNESMMRRELLVNNSLGESQ